VLRKDGSLGSYHWGAERKQAMLAWSSLRGQPASGRVGSRAAVATGAAAQPT
jgi:hypothetical protein